VQKKLTKGHEGHGQRRGFIVHSQWVCLGEATMLADDVKAIDWGGEQHNA
jgi:hypothetical protein